MIANCKLNIPSSQLAGILPTREKKNVPTVHISRYWRLICAWAHYRTDWFRPGLAVVVCRSSNHGWEQYEVTFLCNSFFLCFSSKRVKGLKFFVCPNHSSTWRASNVQPGNVSFNAVKLFSRFPKLRTSVNQCSIVPLWCVKWLYVPLQSILPILPAKM